MFSYQECLNPYKSHLWGLPDPVKPVTDYPGDSKEGIGIFPLFSTDSEGDASLDHHIVKSACWARRSFCGVY